MQRLISLAATIMFWSMVGTSPLQSAQETTYFDVRRPVVVAFFPPVTEAEFNDSGTNDALDDFQFYARRVWQPLRRRASISTKCTRTDFGFASEKYSVPPSQSERWILLCGPG
jgi:hypothetical protein